MFRRIGMASATAKLQTKSVEQWSMSVNGCGMPRKRELRRKRRLDGNFRSVSEPWVRSPTNTLNLLPIKYCVRKGERKENPTKGGNLHYQRVPNPPAPKAGALMVVPLLHTQEVAGSSPAAPTHFQ